jgi:hypothetical protein
LLGGLAELEQLTIGMTPLTLLVYRNGSVESIKKIISFLNEAKLDPNVGRWSWGPSSIS